MMKRNAICFLFAALSHFLFCGGSSEQGNSFHITGQVTTTEGTRTCQLALVPGDFNPITDNDDKIIYTESDCDGNYFFEDIQTGEYYLNAREPESDQRLLRGPITVQEQNIPLGTDTVLPTSYIIADIAPDSPDTIIGFYIKGTTQFVSNVNNHHTLAIPAVPSGTVDIVSVVKTADSPQPVARPYLDNVVVNAADTIGVTYNNRPPVITAMPSQFISNDKNGNAFSDTIHATDPENDPLSYTIVNGPEGLSINESNGAISWQVPLNNATVETFAITVKVADDNGAFTTGTLNIISEPAETVTPTPVFAYGDSMLYTNDPVGSYHLEEIFCSEQPTRYRFEFGNSFRILDTSDWSSIDSITFKWDPESYKNSVRAQAYCSDYSSPSEWTSNFYVWIDTPEVVSHPLIEGSNICVVNTIYSYLPISVECIDDSTYFTIVWGDGDTLHYTPDYSTDTTQMVSHIWNDTGTYTVSIAVACREYPQLSDYSNSLTVTVVADSSMLPLQIKTLKPPFVSSESIEVFDTVFLSADTTICENGLYQFFYNDSAISNKSNLGTEMYIPTVPGIHQFTYAVWCEDTVDYCCYSEPSAVSVKALPDTCALIVEVFTDSINIADEYIIEAAAKRENCQPAITTCNYRYMLNYTYNNVSHADTTEWMLNSDNKFVVPAEPGISVKVSAQSRCGADDLLIYESDWSSVNIAFP